MKALIHDRIVYSPYPNVEIPECSFYTVAKEKLLLNPHKLLLVSDVINLTRRETLAQMERCAVGFRKSGVSLGDRICIHLENGVENLIAIYGSILAGATAVLANPALTESELRHLAEDSESTHIMTDQKNTNLVARVAAALGLKVLFSMGPAEEFISVREFFYLNKEDFVEVAVENPRNTVLAVCYTSGSTGLPKGAEITHYNYVAAVYYTTRHLPWSSSDILLGSAPITHQSGMMYTMLAALGGTTIVMAPSTMTPLEVMDTIDKYKVTAALFFSSQLQIIVREMRLAGRILPTLRRIGTGGSVLPTSVAKAAYEVFCNLEQLLNPYVMTESCGYVTAQPKSAGCRDSTDVGIPVTGVTVKVVDVSTREKLGPHQIGEICFRTPSTMVRGYFKRPRESAELFDEEGWCKSGDAGYYDRDGQLYFCERLKQMIKCMDCQVFPSVLEELLLRVHTTHITEVSVVGLLHSEYGEAPAAAIVLTEEGKKEDIATLVAEIKTTVSSHLALHKRLHGGIYIVDSLPKTKTGKVNKPLLARCLARSLAMAAQS